MQVVGTDWSFVKETPPVGSALCTARRSLPVCRGVGTKNREMTPSFVINSVLGETEGKKRPTLGDLILHFVGGCVLTILLLHLRHLNK